jgi:tRNA G18 (ribose-2'-O)-methylase SpoU
MIRRAKPGDAALAAYREVGNHAALERAGLFVVEGRLVVQRLLEDRRFGVHSVLVTPPAADALAATFAARPDVDVIVGDPTTVETVTGFDFHRGCLALAWRELPLPEARSVLDAPRILALEGIGNPDNVGGLFRSASAFGVDAMLLDPATADPLYRKAIRTSMGATLRVPWQRSAAWPGDLASMRARGCRIIALTPHPDAISLHDVRVEPSSGLVILVGAEGPGLSEAAMAEADVRVRIPIDPRGDSLNVVVAASIALSLLVPNVECQMPNAKCQRPKAKGQRPKAK